MKMESSEHHIDSTDIQMIEEIRVPDVTSNSYTVPDGTYEEQVKSNQTARLEDGLDQRKKLTGHIRRITDFWLCGVAVLVFFEGLSMPVPWLRWITWRLSDTVMITLLSATTVSILGLYVIMARYFISSNDEQK